MRRRRFALTAAAALAVLGPVAAGAHATVLGSSPGRRATLTRPPARVEVWFSERLEPAYSTLSVWDAAGARVDHGDAEVAPDDGRRLRVGVPPLGPGRYVVRFRVLSVDGHVVESEFPFTVTGGRP